MTTPDRVTSQQYDKPYRPWPIALLNALGAGLKKLGVEPVSLSEESLIAAARKQTGLHSFGVGEDGEDSFRVPMRILLAFLSTQRLPGRSHCKILSNFFMYS